jgi:two-component sensor histidine kinase
VRDDGVGFPEGVDFRQTESLGLQIVVTLVSQVSGELKIDRQGGTAFTVVFNELPMKKKA